MFDLLLVVLLVSTMWLFLTIDCLTYGDIDHSLVSKHMDWSAATIVVILTIMPWF